MSHDLRPLLLIFASLILTVLPNASRAEDPPARPADPGQRLERTCFQTHSRWDGKIQLRSDVAVCYGIDATLPERIAQWKAQGYVVHLMTGVSWGQYQDYLYGRFDGVRHVDEAQKDRNGKVISHGGDVYYMSPGENYGKFLCQGVKRAMDAGAEAIHLEEPEFWVRGGYSEGFKREWKAHFGEDWIDPDSSPDAQYRSSQLKYFLYGRALKQVFDFVKSENARTGRKVKCYVPTHSLINYAHWQIVSPESSLIKVGADGFIAQVWTGTARTPNVYRGQAEGAHLRDRLLRIRRDDERRPGQRRDGLVPQRPDRGQPQPLLGRLQDQLGEHPDRLAALAAGLALRGHALARADLPRPLSRRRPRTPKARRAGRADPDPAGLRDGAA